MTISRPISMGRTIWLIARLYLRRQLNRWQSVRFRRKKNDALALTAEPRRSGSLIKSRRFSLFGGSILLFIAFNGIVIASTGLVTLSRLSRNLTISYDRILVGSHTQAALVEADNDLHRLRDLPESVQREQNIVIWNHHLDDVFLAEVRREGLSGEDESTRLQQMHRAFDQKGAAGFTDQSQLWISAETWPRGGQPSFIFLRSLSLIVLLWMSFFVFGSLGLNKKNLGVVELSFEWLYTFPVSTRALFASKLFVYSFLNPAVWLLFFPLLVLVYIAAGYGLGAIFPGMAALIYLSVLAGALCTFLEVALRKLLNLSQLKNIQSLFTMLGTTSLLLFFAAFLSQSFDNFLIARAATMPQGLDWNPFTLPLILGLPAASSSQARIVVLLMTFVALAFCYMSLLGSEWLTREGLVKAGGPYQGTRRLPEGHPRHVWLRGIAAREMLLLVRDRNLLVQVFVVPLLLPVFCLLVYSGKVSVVSGNAAVIAFGMGAYSFLFSAIPVLDREKKTLWQFLTFPQSLVTILAKKTVVWAVLGLLYGGATLLLISRFSRHLHVGSLGEVSLALYGIALYAFVAASIGVLATNVLETEPRRRFRRDMVYLYVILAGMYANTIYSASLWAKLTQLVLSTLLAFALWQKVNDTTPYLLDPVVQPPRSLSLADGMIAALAFFVVQGLLLSFIHTFSNASMAAQITFAYALTGLSVAGFALLIFWRWGLPDLWKKLGVSGAIWPQSQPLATGILRSVSLGGLAALGAVVYVRLLNFLPQGQIWKQDAQLNPFLSRADRPVWVCILAIVAAPVFEELLFRGLIFQVFWRTTGPTLAILGSAAVFALVHPPVSAIPVFILGIAAAISFRKSGFLLAPVLTHAIYNTIVIFVNKS